MAGIYVHIPFCRKACIYCDFHFSTLLQTKTELLSALLREIELKKDYAGGESISTIYFGGGTPSVLEREELSAILQRIAALHKVKEDAEITLEANPDDLSAAKLKELKAAGINRLSIGIQSFIDEELRWMNRPHTAEESVRSVRLAQEAGFRNITIDLIYGSRFQTPATWEAALEKAAHLGVQHLSCYSLTVEEKTALGLKVKRRREQETSEELSAAQLQLLMDWSARSGFEQYEISNFAKEGFISRHNSAYWLGEKYIGLGPSAHSYNLASRQWNVANNALYIKKINAGQAYFEREELDERAKLNEYLLTRLRTKWGIDLQFLQQQFSSLYPHLLAQLQQEVRRGNLIIEGNTVTLSSHGKLVADLVSKNLFT